MGWLALALLLAVVIRWPVLLWPGFYPCVARTYWMKLQLRWLKWRKGVV